MAEEANTTEALGDLYDMIVHDAFERYVQRIAHMSWDEAAAEVRDFAPEHANLMDAMARRWHYLADQAECGVEIR